MSKFLTPPVWYDKNGNVNKMLNGAIFGVSGGIPIGEEASVSGSNGIAIGQEAATISPNGIAIGAAANVFSGNGIAIGGTVGLSSDNGIAIGQGADVSTQNTIQLGNNNEAYALNVGNGTGTLGIGSIKFQKMIIENNRVSISSQGVYLCCTTKNSVSGVAICFIGSLNGSATVLESSTNLCTYVANDTGTGSQVHQIRASSEVTINYCFKIINTST